MKSSLSIQEKLKDLRVEKKLTLEELSAETGISRSALGNYENNDYKDIALANVIILAKYYGVSADYLLGLTDNREKHMYEVDELGLDDETVELLKSRRFNNRLICEMIRHPEFGTFLSDLEIYVDDIAGMQIRNMNLYIERMRKMIQTKTGAPDEDTYMKTLEYAKIDSSDYFNYLLSEDIGKIAADLKAAHTKDIETADAAGPLEEVVSTIEEMETDQDGHIRNELAQYGKLLKINFTKMDPYELKTFSELLEKYSALFRNPGGNRGKRKK